MIYVVLSGRNPQQSAYHMAGAVVEANSETDAIRKVMPNFEALDAVRTENDEYWFDGPVAFDWTERGIDSAKERIADALEQVEYAN